MAERARPGTGGLRPPGDWRRRRLDRPLALAIVDVARWTGLAEGLPVPGERGWLVLLQDARDPDGEPQVLATLGDAAPFLRRAWGWWGPASRANRVAPAALAQVRDVLDEVTAAAVKEDATR
jgi:hypothetical protein